jgi:hypothetical protein
MLTSFPSKQPLGPTGAAQLVPWVPPYLTDGLVVLTDPRSPSLDLRHTMQYLASSNIKPELMSQVVIITADSHEETAAYVSNCLSFILNDALVVRIPHHAALNL